MAAGIISLKKYKGKSTYRINCGETLMIAFTAVSHQGKNCSGYFTGTASYKAATPSSPLLQATTLIIIPAFGDMKAGNPIVFLQ